MSSKGRYRTDTPDLLNTIKDLQDRVSKLERTPQLPSSAINDQNLVINGGGVSVQRDSTGNEGSITIGSDVNISGQDGMTLFITRSKTVETLDSQFPGANLVQFNTVEGEDETIKFPTIQIFDKNGDPLIADSFNARQGFSDPKLSVPWYNPNTLTSSTSGTFATFARLTWYVYHPHLRVSVVTNNPATTTSEITVIDTAGPSTLGTITGPANSVTFTDIVCMRRSLFNSPTVNGNGNNIDIQLRRASGAGTCQAGVTDIVGIDLSLFFDW